MNAIVKPGLPRWEPALMRLPDLAEVLAAEREAYPVPWTHGNFVDSLAAGYPAEVLRDPQGELLGYWVAMPGVDELHLLNITVAPAWQRRGLALVMLDRIVGACRQRGLTQLWLEVRVSNLRAQAVYQRYGFAEVGRRRAYYPVLQGPREDALLMSLMVAA
ncbi:MAG: ribosomal protein S18-alanine N-acetyltransferase [Proteobacteria bacterium]|jgi:[ribosomal protein S18]-alanine N-acetyltransferase|nr:ribosomal-protein-alanine N-acetyltransferase [Methylibium sp.]MCH8857294.1 ribosomal protein S18-alanine N-acetyltransferase [Pseudomonadota bacterium]|mmetsp:Transcript_28304/g.49036  ORF Transcript_28304/g.49036 Transcript_28304/m.49036 type:complete len:161 (-) Transcript_28304:135-617(-)